MKTNYFIIFTLNQHQHFASCQNKLVLFQLQISKLL